MSEDTTTSEQLAEIERQAEPLQVREGRWRTRNGDIRNVTPTPEGDEREERWPWLDAECGQTWGHDGRYFSGGDSPLDLDTYLGPIEPQPEPQPVQVREGRWRKRSGAEVSVSAMPTDHDHFLAAFPWWDGQESTWTHSGHLLSGGECPADLVEYLGPIEQEDKTQEPQPADTVDELRSEVSYLQNLLGESRQRVTHLEELVTSLQRELAVAKEELTTAAAVCQQLQIELDAAQQVPADLPELQQLRLRLADMTLDRDQCKNAYDQIFADLVTIRETTAADTVEAIIEWLEPFRGCNSPSLALLLLEALPHIIRNIVGLNTEDVE